MADYHTGQFTQRDLARKYDVSTATANKLCKLISKSEIVKQYSHFVQKPFENKNDGFLYVIYFKDSANNIFHKIGIASDIKNRLKQHQTSSPFTIRIALCYYCEDTYDEEMFLHSMFKKRNINGEWFILDEKELIEIRNRSLRYENGIQ